MSRRPRIHFPGAVYHCMARGNHGEDIFFTERDFFKLCLLLQEGIERYDHRILGFCFMSNHIHLVIQVASIPLSKIMQNVTFRYTRFINKKTKRMGHLFQGRYKALLVDDSRYLCELIRYVHLNPVRAGIVTRPEDYFWSGHRSYLGEEDFVWVSPSKVLRKMNLEGGEERKRYIKYIYDGIGAGCPVDFEKGSKEDLSVIGDDEFIESLEVARFLEEGPGVTTEDIIEEALEYFNEDQVTISSKSRNHNISRKRAILAYLVREEEGGSLQELSKILNRDVSTLSCAANKIEKGLGVDGILRDDVLKLRERCGRKDQKIKA
jgi:putative transposase